MYLSIVYLYSVRVSAGCERREDSRLTESATGQSYAGRARGEGAGRARRGLCAMRHAACWIRRC